MKKKKKLLINDILNIQQVDGEFKIKSCDIKKATSFFGNEVYEQVNSWKAKKYNVAIKSSVHIQNKKKPKILNVNKDLYFDNKLELPIMMQDKHNRDIKDNIIEGFKVKSDLVKKGLIDNIISNEEKNLKANVWITDEFPIKPDYLVNLISSLGNANEYVGKLKEFFDHADVKEIIEKDGFPVKVMIPVTFFLDVFVQFNGVRELHDPPSNLFQVPKHFKQVTRKQAQDLEHNEKKRFVIANMLM